MLVDWLLVIATFTLAIVAALQDKIRGWFLRPKLMVSITVEPPDCHKTILRSFKVETKFEPAVGAIRNLERVHEADCYYFKLRVKNSGNQRAEKVEVFAAGLSKKDADAAFRPVHDFMPLNLRWSNVHTTYLDAISPEMWKFCDLGHIIDPAKREPFQAENNPDLGISPDKTLLSLDLEVKPNNLLHLVPPGVYRIELLIGAANSKPIRKTFEINHTGNWIADEGKMLKDGIGIFLVE